VGSIGSGTTPGRVYKGSRGPGHMGDRRVTVMGLEIVRVDAERNLLVLRGAIPGARNALVMVRNAVKTPDAGK
jgi:large subunit ribosomal protein L3